MEVNNILSLFDGMSCGQLAFNKLGIDFNEREREVQYFASEIKSFAINHTQKKFPNTIRVGDVCKLHYENDSLYSNCEKIYDDEGNFLYWELGNKIPNSKIDILIGGSPCQNFSRANAVDSRGLEGDKSRLFYEYLRLKREINPKYFLLENVMMSPKWKKIITDTLGVEPILLNSSDVSIQSRKRLYWTNIPVDINIPNTNTHFYNEYSKEFPDDIILTGRGLNKLNRSRSRVYSIEDSKLPTLLKAQEVKPTDAIVIKHGDIYRYPTREEAEKMQTVPIGYTKNAKYNDTMGMLGNGWTVDIIKHIFSFIK